MILNDLNLSKIQFVMMTLSVLVAFGFGVHFSKNKKRWIKFTGCLLIVVAGIELIVLALIAFIPSFELS